MDTQAPIANMDLVTCIVTKGPLLAYSTQFAVVYANLDGVDLPVLYHSRQINQLWGRNVTNKANAVNTIFLIAIQTYTNVYAQAVIPKITSQIVFQLGLCRVTSLQIVQPKRCATMDIANVDKITFSLMKIGFVMITLIQYHMMEGVLSIETVRT